MTTATTKTSLKPTTTANGFVMPAIWSFPPFFTLQPNPTTRAHQLKLWTELILAWAKHNRVFNINADSADAGEVFANKLIGRKLLSPALREVLAHMAKEGNASPDPPKQASSYLIYWRNPEEWGRIIYDWVSNNGLLGTIMTFYEITDGDLSGRTEFRSLPDAVLRRALDALVKRGQAQILRSDGDGDGVRFL